jgi:hypothetical protein
MFIIALAAVLPLVYHRTTLASKQLSLQCNIYDIISMPMAVLRRLQTARLRLSALTGTMRISIRGS